MLLEVTGKGILIFLVRQHAPFSHAMNHDRKFAVKRIDIEKQEQHTRVPRLKPCE